MYKTTKNNSGKMESRKEKTQSIASFEVFCGFREGQQFFGGVLNELIHRNRGVNGQFCGVFERIMRIIWFKNQVPEWRGNANPRKTLKVPGQAGTRDAKMPIP